MVRLLNIVALPHPSGNRVDLSWKLPESSGDLGVRVVRRTATHPKTPDDGVIVAQGIGIDSAEDIDLQAGIIYYYSLYTYTGVLPDFSFDRHNRTRAIATSREDFAGFMYDQLPRIYHRYDTQLPADIPDGMNPADIQRGSLRRFLDLPGGQFDQLYTFARTVLDSHDLEKVDGALLPLLAEWIGWKTDHTLEFRDQRNELRDAQALYKTIGLIPVIEATVKRITGWETRSKEFFHNVFLSNRPERLNIFSAIRDATENWESTDLPFSLDYAYEGKLAAVTDGQNIRWIFYHTERNDRWEIWYKTSPVIRVSLAFQEYLVDGTILENLWQAISDQGFAVARDAVIAVSGNFWTLTEPGGEETYLIQLDPDAISVYHTSAAIPAMAPSSPFSSGEGIDKYPGAVLQSDTVWVFWTTYSESEQKWRIHYRMRNSNGVWSDSDPSVESNPFAEAGAVDDRPQRTKPIVATDDSDRLWLFWLQNNDNGWELRYNSREAGDAGTWGTVVILPPEAGSNPQLETDPIVTISVTDIALFWARKAVGPVSGQTRWEVAYRIKADLALDNANWGPIQTLPKSISDEDHHDREPCPVLDNGNIELFWSSNREGHGWSVWRSILTDPTTNTWTPAEQVIEQTFSQRNPLAIQIDDITWLLYRSNRAIEYRSGVYSATQTSDARYSGSTSVDTRHADKIALRAAIEDYETYTYDTGSTSGRSNDDWYARDTVGLYVEPETIDEVEITMGRERLVPVLNEFMPVTDRAVFVANTDILTERVYSYGLRPDSSSRYITSSYEDVLSSPIIEPEIETDEDAPVN